MRHSVILIFFLLPRVIFAGFDSKYMEALSLFETNDFAGAELKTDELLKESKNGHEYTLASLLKFRAQCAAEKWIEAFENYKAIGGEDKIFNLFKEFYFINCVADFIGKKGIEAIGKSDILETALALSEKLSANGFDKDMKREAHFIKAILLKSSGRSKAALKELKGMLGKKRPPFERGRILCEIAAMGGEKGKKRLLKEIFINYPAAECVEGASSLFMFQDLTPAEQLTRANRLYEAMEYAKAAKIYEELVKNGSAGMDVVYRLGLIHLEKERDDAKKALEYFLTAYAAGKHREDSLYRIARSYAKLENYETALGYYRKYIRDYPRGKYREEAYYYLGWLPFDHGEYEKAIEGFDIYLSRFKRGKKRTYILWFKGWALYRLGRFNEAIKAFDMLLPYGNPLVAGKGLYWSGMAFRKLNNEKAATAKMKEVIKSYPLTYYAVLAAKRLNEWTGEKMPIWISGESPLKEYPPDFWGFDRIKERNILESLRRVKLLVELGEKRRALLLYNKSCRRAENFFKGKEKARFLLTVYIAIGKNYELFLRSRKEFGTHLGKIPDEKSALYWLLEYPAAERGIAKVVAERFNVPEQWIYSIMRQESRYRQYQISHADALGLMQVIPKTAKIIGGKIGVKFDVRKFFDPGQNMLFSAYYLGSLLREFREQFIFASAAYNAGSPPIQRFLDKHRGADFDVMVEEIAYNEARNYCRKVAEHFVRYAYLHLTPKEREEIYQMLFPDRVNYNYLKETNY